MSINERSRLLALPFIQGGQAQKHITHNEALRAIDALLQLAVRGVASAPDADPAEGDRWIVGPAASGAFAGREDAVAVRDGGAWAFLDPNPGWLAWNAAAATLMAWDGTAWVPVTDRSDTVERLGIGAAADELNRLAVAADAVLLTHAGAGHQVKVNKAAPGDTASMLFQTDWGGRAEMGTAGSDDFAVKTSADGAVWNEALAVDAGTGRVRFPSGAEGVADPAFGQGPAITGAYVAGRGLDVVANGTGLLRSTYNMPARFAFDPSLTPDLPGAFTYTGHYGGVWEGEEAMPVDPNKVYRASCLIHQDDVEGDWSAYAAGARHLQYVGLTGYDADGLLISGKHHLRFARGGVDSRTVLTAPLAPGDTVVDVADASGWNDTGTLSWQLGLVIFGYRNGEGRLYEDYSRIVEGDLFDASGVDRAANRITLKRPLPTSMANPDDPDGAWPAGTALANCTGGGAYKYVFCNGQAVPETGRWYRFVNYIGGIDRSPNFSVNNFAPGTATVKMMFLANYSNRAGGFTGYPDTGAGHVIRFAGFSLMPQELASTQARPDGSTEVKVLTADHDAGSVQLRPAGFSVTEA